jgi:hypothetical protein
MAKLSLTDRAHPQLYEINTWVWLEELSAKQGKTVTLGTVPDKEWDALRALGFDFLWLMGVWKRSPAAREISRTTDSLFPAYTAALPGWKKTDVVGSPYAVQAYRPDPRIGTWDELDRVRRKLHARGMGLILDFVPNHTAPDHPWLVRHPEFYIQVDREEHRQNPAASFTAERQGRAYYVARGRDPYFPPWPDSAQLNYFHQPARQAVIAELKKIADHCDGVRCDMAMLVLNEIFATTWARHLPAGERPKEEFWTEAIAAVPGLLLIAEVYWDLEWRLQQLGFHFTYDKRLYDRLRGPAREAALHLKADLAFQSRLVRFLENHDEPRSAAVFGADHLQAAACLVATLPGMRLYHHGQLDGRLLQVPVHLGKAAPESPNSNVRGLYQKLLRQTREEVFHKGAWRLLEVGPEGDGSSDNLIAYEWRFGKVWRVVAVNLSGQAAQGRLPLSDTVKPSGTYRFTDELNGQAYDRDGEDLARNGLFIRLEPYRAHLFAVTGGAER